MRCRYRRRLALVVVLILAMAGCQNSSESERSPDPSSTAPTEEVPSATDDDASSEPSPAPDEDDRQAERERMVADQIAARGIDNPRVLDAMRAVPRHKYVPDPIRPRAYHDRPQPIGHDQTISQPYIVALMSDLLDASPGDKVLEIGTGSGYQAAVLAEMGAQVYTIEIICELAQRATRDLAATGYDTIEVRCGDGYKGWPDEAPFDRIIVTAAPPELPQALVDQLAVGGRLVVPVGERDQMLQVVTKPDEETIETSDTLPVRFVPMVHGEEP